MRTKRLLCIIIDIAMACLLLFLMSYPLTRGLYRHGICGLVLLFLFICHHLLNPHWPKSLFKGRWTWRRILFSSCDIILFFIMLCVFLSSMLLLGEIFAWAPFPMSWWARSLHNSASAWLFVFAAMHLGLHLHVCWNIQGKIYRRIRLLLVLSVILTGFCLFSGSGLPENMFLLNDRRKMPETDIQFLGQYSLIALAFFLIPNLFISRRRSGK